ncbi:MAG: hypothetical protein ABR564_03040 [Candidatus Dormibacteria bacterium]
MRRPWVILVAVVATLAVLTTATIVILAPRKVSAPVDTIPPSDSTDQSTTLIPGVDSSQLGGLGATTGGTAGTAGSAGKAGTAAKPGAAGAGAAGAKNTASDEGVTPTVIKIGFLRPIAPGESKTPDQSSPEIAFVRDINQNQHGINGRVIQLVDEPFVPPDEKSQAQACTDLTESKKVFAVLNEGYYFNGKCLTQDHKSFFAHVNGTSDEEYNAAGGRDVSVGASGQRTLRNMVEAFSSRGDALGLGGKVVGTVEAPDGDTQNQINGGLVPALAAHGHSPAVRSKMAFPPNQAAVQTMVADHQRAGVTAEFLVANAGILQMFMQMADGAGFHPRYYTSDVNSLAQDPLTDTYPSSVFDGAVGMTSTRTGDARSGVPEPGVDSSCRTRYQAAGGKSLDRNSDDYAFMERYCGLISDFAAAVKLAGPDLTRDKLSSAYRSLGSHAFPFSGDISYGPTKLTGGDSQRAVQWHAGGAGCSSGATGCYRPLDGPAFQPYRV